MKKIFYFVLLLFSSQHLFSNELIDGIREKEIQFLEKTSKDCKGIVSSTFRIELDEFPGAYNPSICEGKDGFVLTFRYLPEPIAKPWISFTGALLLDHSFNPLSKPQLLELRNKDCSVVSQAEDARVFCYRDEYYIIYNDNDSVENGTCLDRREIHIAKLSYVDGCFTASRPLKLFHPEQYPYRFWEKNWSPFVWNNSLFLSYTVNPHEVLTIEKDTGLCPPKYYTAPPIYWNWGVMRGGTPAMLIDGEYLAFFHSAKEIVSGATKGNKMWHYFMGAYTFSAEPPFNITKVSPLPINEKTFYTHSENPKRVIFPGGYVVSEKNIYLAYGKDDCEVWIAVINKERLISTLRVVE